MRGSAAFVPALRREIADRYAFDHPSAAGSGEAVAHPMTLKRLAKRKPRYSVKPPP